MTLFTPPNLLDGHRWRGMRVGLLGGSFNPPHEGHLHISEIARRGLGLDCVWWLVTLQNPLKSAAETDSFESRLTLCRTLTHNHPRILVSNLEQSLGTSRSWRTIRALKTHFPYTDFVFLCGADLELQFHHWYRWRNIPSECAMAFVARPPATGMVRNAPIRRLKLRYKTPDSGYPGAPLRPGYAYRITSEPLNFMSSTLIRNLMKTDN